jgi:hypothetical protein
MNHSLVKKLYYKVLIADEIAYDDVPPIVEETEDFEIHIDKENIVFHMKRKFSKVEEARLLAEEYLKTWQVLIGIEYYPDELRFSFEKADIQEDDIQLAQRRSAAYILGDVSVRYPPRKKFPSRPTKFRLSPDVETMYVRYRAYKQGREPLTGMAYMCFTVLKASADNSLRKAAKKYNISDDLLENLKKLANKGGPTEVRKISKNGKYTPLKPTEKIWMEKVVKALIQRVGEWSYDPSARLPKLTKADFQEKGGGADDGVMG